MKQLYKTPESKDLILSLYNEKLESLDIEYENIDVVTSFGRTRVVKTGNKDGNIVFLFHGINAGIPIKVDNGTIADVIHIRDHVQETVNISAGYHNPHSTTEYINFFAMCNILVWLQYIIKYVKV